MPPDCCYVPFAALVTRGGIHPAVQAGKPVITEAAGCIWATDVPTWITAIATAGLLAGAYFTARYARKAFLGQAEQLAEQRRINEKQTGVLELQAAELRESLKQREREAEQRHRGQASRVFITQEAAPTVPTGYAEQEGVGPFVTAAVVNTSDQPIYNTELRWHLGTAGHGEPNPDPIGTILPGASASRMREFPAGFNTDISGAVVRFTDASGVRWLRRSDGYLNEFTAP